MSGVRPNSFNQPVAHELTSFRKAVASNNKESIEKHLSHMKSISEAELNDALFSCIQNFRLEDQSDECLFLLLRNKANPNCFNKDGNTPLIAACKIAQLTIVKHLIDNGAKPDLYNSQGKKHPLQFVLASRKENYDVADYLIGVIGSVNIQIGKTHVLIVTVDKQFTRIFKMLVDKGATLVFGNEQSILHIIMKKKFKDVRKKKKFLKELANRPYLSLIKDKQAKLPIQYETDEEIRNYYNQVFKPKLKATPDKDLHHSRLKEKDMPMKELSRQKQQKKKHKQEQHSLTVEEEGVDQEENFEERFSHGINHDDDKEKIMEVFQEQQEQRKIEEEKEKYKKSFNGNQKILTPVPILNNKKNIKAIIKIPNDKTPTLQKSIIIQKPEKQKFKKLPNNQKKKGPQVNQKKSKSFPAFKKIQMEEEKKQEQPKKKVSSKGSHKEEQNLNGIKKQSSEIKLQPQKTQSENKYDLLPQQIQQIKKIMDEVILFIEETIKQNIQDQNNQVEFIQSESSQNDEKPKVNLLQSLTGQILNYAIKRHEQYTSSQAVIQNIINYLSNKMKLCIESHVDHPFTFKIQLFGSQATGLSITQSDIDLLVITSLSPNELISMLQQYGIFEQEEITEVKFIKSASMPVIKLSLGQTFKYFCVDLTFQLRGHTGLRCAELIQQFQVAEPLLRPLVVNLKRLIYAYGLSDPYKGGVGSYSLTLMAIALLQFTDIEKKQQNIGKLFTEFLLFYGFQLDYVCQAIIIHLPGYNYKPFYSIYQLPNTMDLTPKLVIYDPLNPVNNVGRPTYRIQNLQRMFKIVYIRLTQMELSIQDILAPQFMDLIHESL